MSRYLLSPAAQADLEQIWDYTLASAGMSTRPRSTCANCSSLSNAPLRNPRISQAPATRSRRLPQARRRIAHPCTYRVTAEGVVDIMRVLHQRMDVDRNL